jgi:hypothetical protein
VLGFGNPELSPHPFVVPFPPSMHVLYSGWG